MVNKRIVKRQAAAAIRDIIQAADRYIKAERRLERIMRTERNARMRRPEQQPTSAAPSIPQQRVST